MQPAAPQKSRSLCILSTAITPLITSAGIVLLGPDQPTGYIPTLWLLGISSLLLLASLLGKTEKQRETYTGFTPIECLTLGSIAAFSLLCRTWRITEHPLQLHNDEMSTVLSVDSFLGASPPPLFATGWQSQPNFGFFLASLVERLTGNDLLGVRLASAIFGTAFVIVLYLFVRSILGRATAAISATVAATFVLHLHFTRTAFQQSPCLLMTLLSLAIVCTGIRNRSLPLLTGGAIAWGLALQTYSIALLVPVVVAPFALRLLADRNIPCKARLCMLAIPSLTLVATVLPLLSYHHHTESAFAARARTEVYTFSPQNIPTLVHEFGTADPGVVLPHYARLSFGYLFVGGDSSVQFGLSGSPIDPMAQLCLILGFIAALWWRRSFGTLVMLLWTVLTLVLGGMLTLHPPFAPRLSSLAISVPVLIALGIEALMALGRRVSGSRSVGGAIGVVALGLITFWNLSTYFKHYRSPAAPRDEIARIAARLESPLVINCRREAELYTHETYLKLVPGMVGFNRDDPVESKRRYGGSILVIGDSSDWSGCRLFESIEHRFVVMESGTLIHFPVHYATGILQE